MTTGCRRSIHSLCVEEARVAVMGRYDVLTQLTPSPGKDGM